MSKFLKKIETLNTRMSFLSFFYVYQTTSFNFSTCPFDKKLVFYNFVDIWLIFVNIGQYLSILTNIYWYLSIYGTAHVPILPILLISSISVPILPISAYSASICTLSAYWKSICHSRPHRICHSRPHRWAGPAACPGTLWLPPHAMGSGHYIHIYIYMYTNNTSTRG